MASSQQAPRGDSELQKQNMPSSYVVPSLLSGGKVKMCIGNLEGK